MHLNAENVLKKPNKLQRLTGLNEQEFHELEEPFRQVYERLVIEPSMKRAERKRAYGGGRKGEIPEITDKLLFILVYTKVYPLLFVQGILFGMEEYPACRWVKILLPVLDETGGTIHLKPKQAKGKSVEELIEEFPEIKELGSLVDGVERPVRRSKDAEKQAEQYSGKKKRHMTKRVTLVHPKTQYILATSQEHPGSVHDKKIIDEEQMTCTEPLTIKGDSGFQGLEIGSSQVITPHKKKRKRKGEPKDELSPEQRQWNRELAHERIGIEHSNAGFKRNRSAADILRNTREGIGKLFDEIAMALHNLRVTARASYHLA
jgi:DDE superfamily endonuclease/Helix-turn-helix of DDE superfamily endonuclease